MCHCFYCGYYLCFLWRPIADRCLYSTEHLTHSFLATELLSLSEIIQNCYRNTVIGIDPQDKGLFLRSTNLRNERSTIGTCQSLYILNSYYCSISLVSKLCKIRPMPIINTLLILFLVITSINSAAETIYEWTDPWGHVQYSQTPVPGSRVSEVTELPKTRETSEQQKKQAMSRKIKQMNTINLHNREKAIRNRQLRKHVKVNEDYCNKLRTLLVDVRIRMNRTHSDLLFYEFYLPGSFMLNRAHYQTQENNLYREIRKNCR